MQKPSIKYKNIITENPNPIPNITIDKYVIHIFSEKKRITFPNIITALPIIMALFMIIYWIYIWQPTLASTNPPKKPKQVKEKVRNGSIKNA